MRWRQAYHGHVLGWGNAYAEIIRNGRGTEGEPVQLHLLDPRTRPDRKGGRLIYRDPDGVEYRPRNVLHLAGLGYDGLCGYSPVALARHGIRLGLNAQQSGISLFANGALPKGVLQVPQQLKPDAYKRLRESWELIHRGVENAHKIAILEQGATWQQTSIDPEDAQFLASRQFSVVEVSRFYRIPPNLIGDLTQSHLNNFEASQIDYVTKTLAPWLVNLEQEIGLKLLTKEERKAGLYVKHNMAALLRGDMRARAEFYTKMRDLGAFSPNMILAKEDMNPIEGGDIHLVPVNMQELSRAALPPEPAPAPPGKPPAPDGPNETQDDDEAENEGPASRTAPLNGARFHL
jgi:HK97 family phage portal protein